MNKFFVQLEKDFPYLRFKIGERFLFKPPRTIFLSEAGKNIELLSLHEVSHALLGHRDFKTDIERLKMEMDAWEKARELAVSYSLEIDEDLIQEELDTYRDWLHKRSKCKKCGLTRFQTRDQKYHCPYCDLLH